MKDTAAKSFDLLAPLQYSIFSMLLKKMFKSISDGYIDTVYARKQIT